MSFDWRAPQLDLLVRALAALETPEECRRFLEDLCTIPEIKSMAQRIEVAQMLRQKNTYLHIAGQTGASTATISRVNRALTYGTGGYDLALKRISPPTNEEE